MFAVLYVITGLGITVGYHRLLTHRSFECPDWVKACLLIAGGWALQNSGAKWTADHLRHHAHCDDPADPYNAKRGFWYSHCGWLLNPVPCNDERFGSRVMQDRVAMWQHRHYAAIVLVGLALPFVVGFGYDGWKGGIGGFMLAGVGRTFAVLNSTFLHQFCLSLMGRTALQHDQFKPQFVVCVSADIWRRLSQLSPTPRIQVTIATDRLGITILIRRNGSFLCVVENGPCLFPPDSLCRSLRRQTYDLHAGHALRMLVPRGSIYVGDVSRPRHMLFIIASLGKKSSPGI